MSHLTERQHQAICQHHAVKTPSPTHKPMFINTPVRMLHTQRFLLPGPCPSLPSCQSQPTTAWRGDFMLNVFTSWLEINHEFSSYPGDLQISSSMSTVPWPYSRPVDSPLSLFSICSMWMGKSHPHTLQIIPRTISVYGASSTDIFISQKMEDVIGPLLSHSLAYSEGI